MPYLAENLPLPRLAFNLLFSSYSPVLPLIVQT